MRLSEKEEGHLCAALEKLIISIRVGWVGGSDALQFGGAIRVLENVY